MGVGGMTSSTWLHAGAHTRTCAPPSVSTPRRPSGGAPRPSCPSACVAVNAARGVPVRSAARSPPSEGPAPRASEHRVSLRRASRISSSVPARFVRASAGMRPPRAASSECTFPTSAYASVSGDERVAHQHVGPPRLEHLERFVDGAGDDGPTRRAAAARRSAARARRVPIEQQHADAVKQRRRLTPASASGGAHRRIGLVGRAKRQADREHGAAPPRCSRTVISPPCRSTSSRTSDSPTPSPPDTRVGDESACVKRSKMRGRNRGIDARPGVADSDARLPVGLERHVNAAAARRELDRVREQVPDRPGAAGSHRRARPSAPRRSERSG